MPIKSITTQEECLVKTLYKKGFSGSEIAEKLQISLKQIYSSLCRQRVSRRSFSEQRELRFKKEPLSFAFKEVLSVKERELLVAGLMLYYGEGAKTGYTVDFANADPVLVKVFLKFLRVICGIDQKRLRFYLYCFSNQDSKDLIYFWCSHLGVESGQFTRPHIRSTLNKSKRIMTYGLLHVRYSDKRLLEKILLLGHEMASTL